VIGANARPRASAHASVFSPVAHFDVLMQLGRPPERESGIFMNADIIVVADAGQIQTVANLARDIWTEHYTPIIGRAQVDYMLERFQSVAAITSQLAHGCHYVLIHHAGVAGGYLAFIPEPETRSLMISKIYVRSATRSLGLGCRLMAYAEEQARQRQLATLWLTVNKHNTASIAWYRKRGFTEVRELVQEIGGGFVMDDYRMEKRVACFTQPISGR
jgi:ribosomal protein S18 acetylase RimI-like enzyme